MTDTSTPKLNRGIVLRFMKEALKQCYDQRNLSYASLAIVTRNKLIQAHFVDYSHIEFRQFRDFPDDDPLINTLAECYHPLFVAGYIIPVTDKQTATFDYRYFVITEVGHQWLASSSDWIPEDQQGYLSALKVLVPTVDPVIEQYVQEALLTYDRGALFASAVMIGAASEKAVYLLMEALYRAVIDSTRRETIRKTIEEERSLSRMLRQLRDNINRAKSASTMGANRLSPMPYHVHENSDHYLFAIEDAIRVQRNEAVHPNTGGRVQRESVRLALSAFPSACKKIYDLMNWFSNNKLP